MCLLGLQMICITNHGEIRWGHDFILGITPEERDITVVLITLPRGNYAMVTKFLQQR